MPDELKTGFNIEQAPAPETETPAAPIEQPAVVEQRPAAAASVLPPPAPPRAPVAAPKPPKEPLLIEVEEVLTENIADIYKQLPEQKKALFRRTGEQVAAQITQMMKSGIMQIKKVLGWIRTWLMIIPGVNQFFLEQEAKIKSDKINELFLRQHAPA